MNTLQSALTLFATTLTMCTFAQAPTPEIFSPGVISGPVNDAAPAFSPDGHTVYFQRIGPGMTGAILVSQFRDGRWSAPVLAPFSGQWQDIEPAMAPDGSYLIFSSNRPGAKGGQALNGAWNGNKYPDRGGNLWRVDRKGEGWGEPYRLPDIVNSDSSVFTPAISADGALYFMKPVGDTGKFHLYRCACRDGQYQLPVRLPFSMVDSVADVDLTVAPDESFAVFCSRRPPATHLELWIIFRDHGSWGIPINLGPEVNRAAYQIEAKLSPDHRRLYFSCPFVPKPADIPSKQEDRQRALDHSAWETGLDNIWSVSLDRWLEGR